MMLNEARLNKIVNESIKSVLKEDYESEKKAAWDRIKAAKKKAQKDPESREAAKELSDAHDELERVYDKYEKWTTKGKLYNDDDERTGTYKSTRKHNEKTKEKYTDEKTGKERTRTVTKNPRNKNIWREDK